jgi:hypothetical protein
MFQVQLLRADFTYLCGSDLIWRHVQPFVCALNEVVVHILAAGPDVAVCNVQVRNGLCEGAAESEELLTLLGEPTNL